MLQAPPLANKAVQDGLPDAIEVHMVAYYYAALTNLICQVCFPIQWAEGNDAIGAVIDASYRDFHMLDSWLAALDPNEIWASPNSHLYLEVRDVWRHQIKDQTMISKRS
jgi:hypothetical protein